MDRKNKIAVFISGPPRYVNLVVQRTEKIIGKTKYDFFINLQKDDRGNKVREQTYFDYNELLKNKRVKILTFHTAYEEADYKDTVGTKTNSGSKIHATMGMFMGVNALCHRIKVLPDFDTYTHVLRLRTDCVILNPKFVRLLDFSESVITVSENYIIPAHWISDHIMFTTVDNFFKIWMHPTMEGIYNAYRSGGRNPERTLAKIVSRSFIVQPRINKNILRYRDYHIVYSPPRPEDPKWSNKMVTDKKIKNLFLHPEKFIDSKEVAELNHELLARRPSWYEESKMAKLLFRLKTKFK